MKSTKEQTEALNKAPSAGPTLDYSQWKKPTYSQTGQVKATHQTQTATGTMNAPKPVNFGKSLQTLHKAYQAKSMLSQPQSLAKAWQQPAMNSQQQREYQRLKSALVNPNTNLETMNQIADPNHPMFPFLTRQDHLTAYKHWYNLANSHPDEQFKEQAKMNARAHNNQSYEKV